MGREMPAIEDLINLIITFAFVAAPAYIMMSRRRRAQGQEQEQEQEQEQRRGTQPSRAPAAARTPTPRERGRSRETEPTEEFRHLAERREAAEEIAKRRSDRDLSVRPAPGRIHRGDDGGYTERRQEQWQQVLEEQPEQTGAAAVRKPIRIEAVLRELLGVPDDQEQRAREEEHQREPARRRAAKPAKKRATGTARGVEPSVARSPDVHLRAVMPDAGSLSLSPGGMGSQQMRTAAGNLGASSSVEKTPPVPQQLGSGWKRISTLSEFKRAIMLAEVLGKPHSLKDLDA